jgi:uncharacterized protein YndB with AHSA1/START domain
VTIGEQSHSAGSTADWPVMPAVSDALFPPLQAVSARPVSQERWERLVTEITIPTAAGQVWRALTDAPAVGHWLAECRGHWAAPDEEATLDFGDGEFFFCRTEVAEPPNADRPGRLRYLWRWVGIGPATAVTWEIRDQGGATTVTVVEEAVNPSSDWRSWNGMGWPGILEQLAGYLRDGGKWRWVWRRMGPYIQAELPLAPYEAWEAVTSAAAVKYWLQRAGGSLSTGDPMTVVMGDASGVVHLTVTRSVEAAQEFPSYLPYLEFQLGRPGWRQSLTGRLWIEPAGLGRSLLQVFHQGWESLELGDPLAERRILTGFWIGAVRRAQAMINQSAAPQGPHGWST